MSKIGPIVIPVCGSKKEFVPFEKKCTLCYNSFVISDKNKKYVKTCGCGCKRIKSNSYQFSQDSVKIHGNIYDYSKVGYKGVLVKVVITCKRHGDFLQFPQDHLTGSGCAKCRASHGERRIRRFLEDNSIIHFSQHKFIDCVNPISGRMLAFDYYIPNKNMVIEYDGEQHFRLGKLGGHTMTMQDLLDIQHRDSIKTKYASDKNLTLLRISYKQINKVDNILQKEIYG